MGGKGGPKGEEDALAFFVGLFSSLFKKKIIIICCLVIFIGFLLLGIDVVILGGKQSRQERGRGAGLPGRAGESHIRAGSEAGVGFGSLSHLRDKDRATQAFPPSCKILSRSQLGEPLSTPRPGPP